MHRMADDPHVAQSRARVAALREQLEARENAPVRLIETHISWVLLAGRVAYKFKKPVRLAFLDFTALDERRRFCEEELRLNRRLAPELYLDVVEVHDGPRDRASTARGRGRLRRADATLCRRCALERVSRGRKPGRGGRRGLRTPPGRRTPRRWQRPRSASASLLAVRVTAGSSPASTPGRRACALPNAAWPGLRLWLRRGARAPRGPLAEPPALGPRSRVPRRPASGEHRPAWRGGHRLRRDRVRPGVALDRCARRPGLPGHGPAGPRSARPRFRLLDGYLEESGDHEGLRALRFFLVRRALVRAEVAALRGAAGDVPRAAPRSYLRLACALARAMTRAWRSPPDCPGRARPSYRRGCSSRSVPCAYARTSSASACSASRRSSPRATRSRRPLRHRRDRATYARLLAVAGKVLAGGWPTIVDAAFLRRDERDGVRGARGCLRRAVHDPRLPGRCRSCAADRSPTRARR